MRSLVTIVLTMLLVALNGCGGGSSGTGTGPISRVTTINGTVVTDQGAPVSGLVITLAETGSSAVTNSGGEFVLSDDLTESDILLLLQSAGLSGSVTIRSTDVGEASNIDVEITLNEESQTFSISELESQAKVIGECDFYFENFSTIRQANRAPQGIECTARVIVRGDGQLLSGIPVVIQRRRCPRRSAWHTIASGTTGAGIDAGRALVNFEFFNNDDFCVYRIVAPFQVEGLPDVSTEIHTFTKQSFDEQQ